MAEKGKNKSQVEMDLIGEDLKEVEKILYNYSTSEVTLINEVSGHLLGSGGKRFRPALVLLSSRMCGYKGRHHVACAASVEFAHTATLLHDDVIDEARTRRGRPSANLLWGNEASVLVGDFLLFQGYQLLMRVEDFRLLKLIIATAVRMAEGEVLELAYKGKPHISEDRYFSVITDKTAVLMSTACRMGAVLGGVSQAREKALGDFGMDLGIAFQLVDDALDYTGKESLWGKEVGKDFGEAKATLPLIHTYRNSPSRMRKRIEELFKKPNRTKKDFREILGHIKERGGMAYTFDMAAEYIDRAKGRLDMFKDCPEKRELMMMADYVVKRDI